MMATALGSLRRLGSNIHKKSHIVFLNTYNKPCGGISSTTTSSSFWSTASTPMSTSTSTTTETKKNVINKKDIAREIAETHELSLAKSERILNTVLDTIVEKVVDDQIVSLSNFGRFDCYESKGFEARNPSTGQTVSVPPKMRPRFRPFLSFKTSVNDKM